jgi:hypothetical protein
MINRLVRNIKIYHYALLLSLFDTIAAELPRLRPWAQRKGDLVWRKFARAKISLLPARPYAASRKQGKWSYEMSELEEFNTRKFKLVIPSSVDLGDFVKPSLGFSPTEKEISRFVRTAQKPFVLTDVVLHLRRVHLLPPGPGDVSPQTKKDIDFYLQQAGAVKITRPLYGSDPVIPLRILHTYERPAHPQPR